MDCIDQNKPSVKLKVGGCGEFDTRRRREVGELGNQVKMDGWMEDDDYDDGDAWGSGRFSFLSTVGC